MSRCPAYRSVHASGPTRQPRSQAYPGAPGNPDPCRDAITRRPPSRGGGVVARATEDVRRRAAGLSGYGRSRGDKGCCRKGSAPRALDSFGIPQTPSAGRCRRGRQPADVARTRGGGRGTRLASLLQVGSIADDVGSPAHGDPIVGAPGATPLNAGGRPSSVFDTARRRPCRRAKGGARSRRNGRGIQGPGHMESPMSN